MRKLLRAMFIVLALILSSSAGFPWGYEGHQVIALIAMKYMTADAQAKAGDLLDGSAIDAVASWADEYRHDHPETGPWHYIVSFRQACAGFRKRPVNPFSAIEGRGCYSHIGERDMRSLRQC